MPSTLPHADVRGLRENPDRAILVRVVQTDRSLKHTYDGPVGGFYDEFGAYRTDSGQGPATVVWSGIRFWRE
ncbi:hypothetical protein [Saccharothrix luteola]|uniref:hypothetical protein n=1 Tax=Saccharothrix luteola TaxID=2893018 RepID=UPI001E32F1AF|nr:hypothetical protein [Saccharothrix luteola]MCC8251351.1 hypothetical protein [Saccharothrix luteola]